MLKVNKEKHEVKTEYDRIIKESGLDALIPLDTEDGNAGYCTEDGILKSTTDDNYFYRADWESNGSWIYLCVYADGTVHCSYSVKTRGKIINNEDVSTYNCPIQMQNIKVGVEIYAGRN